MGYAHDAGTIVTKLTEIADTYERRRSPQSPLLPDFDSARQALNVASADQRVLIVLQGEDLPLEKARETLRAIAWSDDIIGRFHYDVSPESRWHDSVDGLADTAGIHLIFPSEFGNEGTLHCSLTLSASPDAIRRALIAANREHAATTQPKVYARHVTRGRQQGIYFEGNVPYGEDRDADGEIDHHRGRRSDADSKTAP